MANFEWKVQQGRERGHRPAGALNPLFYPARRADLEALSLVDLSGELVARLSSGEAYARDRDLVLAGQLQDMLESRLDVHLNRFARRRFYDLISPILGHVPGGAFQNATIMDLGSGSLNPFVFGFLFLMLGARRAYSVDLEPVHDLGRAVRALATAAAWLIVDPVSVIGSHRVEARSVLENLHGFDLAKLASGHPDGIAPDRLIYLIESIDRLSVADGGVDFVSSVSLLEHVDDIDAALSQLRRVTTPGGIGHHVVDFVDHRLYGREIEGPFEFLKIESSEALVHGCNRVRYGQMRERFEAHGFTVEYVEPCRTDPLVDDERRRFVEPYRSMALEDLAMTCARFFVRRR